MRQRRLGKVKLRREKFICKSLEAGKLGPFREIQRAQDSWMAETNSLSAL